MEARVLDLKGPLQGKKKRQNLIPRKDYPDQQFKGSWSSRLTRGRRKPLEDDYDNEFCDFAENSFIFWYY